MYHKGIMLLHSIVKIQHFFPLRNNINLLIIYISMVYEFGI